MSTRIIEIPRARRRFSGESVADGTFTVIAEAAGPFNIFRSPGTSESGWTLSHRRTGRAVRYDLRSRASARRLAEALCGFNWEFDPIGNPPPGGVAWGCFPRKNRREMRQAAKIAREWER